MIKFNGFADWVEIFRGGPQTDNKGAAHDGDQLIDAAISTFDPAMHEPPLCVGHPQDNSPAFGWVSALKADVADGVKTLFAKFSQVQPEFEAAVEKGLYRKRSASFYPDGRLRHVGFLGGAPPAVKGLADLKFHDGAEPVCFEFSESWKMSTVARVMRRLREFFIAKFGQEAADGVVSNYDIEDLTAPEGEETAAIAYSGPPQTQEDDMPFTQEQVDQMLDRQKKEFSDQIGALEARIAEARTQGKNEAAAEFAEQQKAQRAVARKQQIADWIGRMTAEGRITPAQVKSGIGVFCERLDAEIEISFSEEGVTASPLGFFQKMVEALPPQVEFAEIAHRGNNVAGSDAGGKLEALTRARMKEKPDLAYSAAFSEIQSENPALACEYAQELNQ